MDVLHLQRGMAWMNSEIDSLQQSIDAMATANGDAFEQVRRMVTKLDELDKQVMEGDWGGYYSARRPLIQRLNHLRNRLQIPIKSRTDEEWSRPAPLNRRDIPIDPIFPFGFGRRESHSTVSETEMTNVETNGNRPSFNVSDHGTHLNDVSDLSDIDLTLLAVTETNLLQNIKESSSTCSICLTDFANEQDGGTEISLTACEHLFHTCCLMMWCRVQHRSKSASVQCPICRNAIVEICG